ncbi:MAG: gliding motility-associated C-terminal domain-containing protein [Bacteroidetes bacterium]|nr:gliding motility-associated C-terminal domain-containing protein [Bacteroidota bacterium]
MKSYFLLILLLSILGGKAAETSNFEMKVLKVGFSARAFTTGCRANLNNEYLFESNEVGKSKKVVLALPGKTFNRTKILDTITICKDIRNIIFSIKTLTGNAIAWKWTFTGTSFAGVTNDSICGPVPYNTIGTYLATCLVTFSGGKDSLHTFVIRVFDGKVQAPLLHDSIFCGPINITLDGQNASNAIAKYRWVPSGQTSRTINVTSAGTYGVSVYTVDDYSYKCTNCLACDSQTSQVNIILGAKATVNLGPDRFICGDNAVILDAGPGYTTYLWQPNSETSQSIAVLHGGTYSVSVTNADGCTASDQIFLKDSCPAYIFIPNAFSPDGNAKNDVFNWAGNMKISTFHMEIFNRWGQNIFKTDDQNQGWDGFYNNQPAMEGVYIYLLECRDFNGFRHHLKGTFSLLR